MRKPNFSSLYLAITFASLATGWIALKSWTSYLNSQDAQPAFLLVTRCEFRSSSSIREWGRVYGSINEEGYSVTSFSTMEFKNYAAHFDANSDEVIESHDCQKGKKFPIWVYKDESIHQRSLANQSTSPLLADLDRATGWKYSLFSLVLAFSGFALFFLKRKVQILSLFLFVTPWFPVSNISAQAFKSYMISEFSTKETRGDLYFYPSAYPNLIIQKIDTTELLLQAPENALQCNLNATSKEYTAYCSQTTEYLRVKSEKHYNLVKNATSEDMIFKLLVKLETYNGVDSIAFIKYEIQNLKIHKGYNAVKRFIKIGDSWKIMTEPYISDIEPVFLLFSTSFLKNLMLSKETLEANYSINFNELSTEGKIDFTKLYNYIDNNQPLSQNPCFNTLTFALK